MTTTPTRRGRGAPKGNTNALKTGQHTAERRAFRINARVQLAKAKALIAMVHSTPGLTRVVVTRHDQR